MSKQVFDRSELIFFAILCASFFASFAYMMHEATAARIRLAELAVVASDTRRIPAERRPN